MFSKKAFSGGVHPPENKKATEKKPIEKVPLPKEVIIPVQQHIGAPSEPVVQVGQKVQAGDKISEAKGFISVPAHATISGTVKKIEPRPHPFGTEVLSMVIEADGDQAINPNIQFDPNYLELSNEEMIQRVREAGLAGMGGAAFPTHVKLSPPANKPIDIFILNGAECEPYLTSDHRLMLEETENILKGMEIICRILAVKKGFIGIERNKPDAIARFREEIAKANLNFKVIGFDVKYPQGAEKQLIYAATGRKVPAGGLPMDVGCLVQNVGTAAAVYNAVAWHKPLIERVVTITGNGIREPKNVLARIGTPFTHLFEYCGGLVNGVDKIIMGGPMMGLAQFSDQVPVIKGTSGILLLADAQARMTQEQNCIRCARCVDACPMGLLPTLIAEMVKHNRFENARNLNVLDCIECGSCTYVCPSKINLVHYIKYGKMEAMKAIRAANAAAPK